MTRAYVLWHAYTDGWLDGARACLTIIEVAP